MKPLIISAVTDTSIYNSCITQNPNCAQCDFCGVDNHLNNENVPIIYNRAISSLPDTHERWLIFCHQDFEIREAWGTILGALDPSVIYGPVGFTYYKRNWWDVCVATHGELSQSAKDGSGINYISHKVQTGTIVDTVDCVCLVVHSTLIRKNNLRFDENLSFDLYAEDFSIAAREQFGIKTGVISLHAHHWSNSVPIDRYYIQLDYLNRKWPKVCYAAACSFGVGGGWNYVGILRRLKTFGIKSRVRAIHNLIIPQTR